MNKSVLIVVNSLGLGGGAERIASQVGTHLSRRGHDVTFLERYEKETRYDYEGDLVSLYSKSDRNSPKTKKLFRELKASKQIVEMCKKRGIDTVVSFSTPPNYLVILSKIVFGNPSKTIISVRNNPLNSSYKSLKKFLYPKADKVVTLSRGVENKLNQNFSIKNTTTIYNLQDIDDFKKLGKENVNRSHKHLYNEGPIYINIGSLTRQKGQWYLIRSFKRIVENNEDSRLVVLGEGKLRKRLESLVDKLDLKKNVHLLGKVENVFPYLKKADCFVLSSLYEGFGNVLTEALSQNTPVISTDCVAGPREILCPELSLEEDIEYPYLGECGILTKNFESEMFFDSLEEKPLTDSEEMLADMMIKIYEDEELRKKYSTGLERAKDFDVDKIVDQWEEVI